MDSVNHIKVFINITDPFIPQLFIQCTSYLNVCRSRSMNKRVWSCEDHHFLLCHCNLHKFVIPEWLFLPIRVIGIITDCYTSSQFVSNHKSSANPWSRFLLGFFFSFVFRLRCFMFVAQRFKIFNFKVCSWTENLGEFGVTFHSR